MAAAEEPRSEGDWAGQLAARLESFTEVLRNYSVRPVLGAVRFLLAGAVGLVIGIAVIAALVIGLVKLFDTDVFSGKVWATDFLIGGMLVVAGALLFRQGVRKKDPGNG